MKHASKLSAKQTIRAPLFIARTAAIFSCDEDEALQIISITPHPAFRLNPLKNGAPPAGIRTQPLPWIHDGFCATTGDISRHAAVSTGEIFIQNPSSWLPVLALDPQPGDTILDMCAAPGGKSSHVAAITSNQAHITAIDTSKDRLIRMKSLHAQLGVANIEYHLRDARFVKTTHPEQFDKILLDAPCSGETEIHDPHTQLGTWSPAKIKRLSALQKSLLLAGLAALKPGGTLIYSTCTFAPEENELVLDYALKRFEDVQLAPLPQTVLSIPDLIPALPAWHSKNVDPTIPAHTRRVKPSQTMQGFFLAKFSKTP